MSDDYLDLSPIDWANTLDWRWETACRELCEEYHAKQTKKVQAPVFDFLVDREVWETFFSDIKDKMAPQSLLKIPPWPFRITPQMTQDSQPSSPEYIKYQRDRMRMKRKRAKRESWISDISLEAAPSDASSSSVPQVPLPALNPTSDASSNDAGASVSQAPSTVPPEINLKVLTSSLPRGSSAHSLRQGLWKLAGGDDTFRPPITGPFQMKLPDLAPLNWFVTGANFEDLAKITRDFLPRGLALKVEITSNDSKDTEFHEVLTLGFAKGCGDKAYDWAELLRFWGYMTEWLSTVYHGASTTLRQHLFSLHHKTTSTGRVPSTRSYNEMAHNDDKKKQVPDDINISGPPLHVLPHSAFKHPPSDRVVILMGNGMIVRYAVQHLNHRWMTWPKSKKPDCAVHIQGESDVTLRSGEPVVVEFQSDLIFTAKLYPHRGTAGKDEVKCNIEYDEEVLLGSDDMLWMREPKEKAPVEKVT
ncbi:uncharacterized protein FTJAE_7883 [Fusarium tjaetaba]|uniref:Uncharacterized protein n=1 Tax=Fusarium tjaetaba TaxID=1567544 RepID=A0A8H5R969_9HYPO|nr:uncharacterized protein FTJAE_7883 [Fusarium tjaetaba]KAF5631480.1 hypothetical protein FTJAE_7883 [Fusarium tjaetaba]